MTIEREEQMENEMKELNINLMSGCNLLVFHPWTLEQNDILSMFDDSDIELVEELPIRAHLSQCQYFTMTCGYLLKLVFSSTLYEEGGRE